jgi:hypothetical protein
MAKHAGDHLRVELEELHRVLGRAGASRRRRRKSCCVAGFVLLVEADGDGLLAKRADGDDDLPGIAGFRQFPAGALDDSPGRAGIGDGERRLRVPKSIPAEAGLGTGAGGWGSENWLGFTCAALHRLLDHAGHHAVAGTHAHTHPPPPPWFSAILPMLLAA